MDYINIAANTPYPPWVFSSVLLYRGITATKPLQIAGSSGSSAQFSQSLSVAKPNRASCFTFGLTTALGGYMIYDGEIENGAGFTSAWSTMYLLVNGKASVRSVLSGRVSPIALSLLALGNASIYGRKYFWRD